MQIRLWVALHPWQSLLQEILGKTSPAGRQKPLRSPSPSSWPRPGPRREHHTSTCTRHAQSPFLRKSLGMELLLLRVPLPRRLLINRIGSFRATASIDAGLGASLYNLGASTSVIPPWEREQSAPIPPHSSPPSCGTGRRHLLYPHCAWPSPQAGLLCTRRWLGAAVLSLLCPALPCYCALPPPGYQARGGAGPARPAPAVERAWSVTRGHPQLGPFISALPGRREEETRRVALSAGDTFPGLYKLSTWDG